MLLTTTLLTGFVSWLLLCRLIPFLTRNFLDKPNDRSSHFIETPSGGGGVFVLIGTLGVCFLGNSIPLICLPLATIGFIDDWYQLPSNVRFGGQVFTAVLLLLISPLSKTILNLYSFPLTILIYLVLIFFATALINFTNFMDGMDGLIGGCMAIILSVAALTNHAILPLVGALIGFVLLNWSPAKVFMGDVGSTFLGGVFVGLILDATTWQRGMGLLLVATPLLSDAFVCLCRRTIAKQPIFKAHRLHLYQRLHQAGWSHSHVSLLYVMATFLLAISYLLIDQWPLLIFLTVVLELSFGYWLDKNQAVSFDLSIDT